MVPTANREIALTASELGFRLNGKRSKDFRTCKLEFGKSPGSCEVVFEPGTRVFTQVEYITQIVYM